jgi:hypothetical protein
VLWEQLVAPPLPTMTPLVPLPTFWHGSVVDVVDEVEVVEAVVADEAVVRVGPELERRGAVVAVRAAAGDAAVVVGGALVVLVVVVDPATASWTWVSRSGPAAASAGQ